MSEARRHQWLGVTAYGALFTLVLPSCLAAWAFALEPAVALQPLHAPVSGLAIALAGMLLMGASMLVLWRRGGGLPMSPYPPSKRAIEGPYRWIANPIYAGFTITCAGVAIHLGSAAGLYVVTPTVALAATAFVLGYERDETRRRVGPPSSQTVLRLPAAEETFPSWADRLSIYVLVLVPWIITYATVIYRGVPHDAIDTLLPIDARIPIWPWTEALYASTYLFVALVPIVARTRLQLRTFAIRGWIATVFVGSLQLLLPFVMSPRLVPGGGPFSTMMRWERFVDASTGAMPAFHVVWALLAAEAFATTWPRAKWAVRCYALLLAGSCLTTGSHSIADVVAGFAAFAIVASYTSIWESIRHGTESIANSWHEWTLGPVRLMSHGFWAGSAVFAGLLMIVWMTGGARLGWTLAIALAGIIGAALTAQFLEGSSQLLRPYGYFGCVAGVLAAAVLVAVIDRSALVLLGAFAVAAPVIHMISRGRCLVQGCCHGREAAERIGIRYTHPRSRVVRLSGLGGVPIHNTPLYSMLWNLAVAAILIRIWSLGASAELLTGIYLVLAGLGRFVEEHFRGEPQTKVAWGLRIYQRFSIAFVVGGAILSVAGSTPMPAPLAPSMGAIAAVLGFAIFATAAYGADLPNAQFRFSRLV